MIKKFLNLNRACPAKLLRSGGFTVLESIVAIAILSLSISGAFSAVTQSLSQATIAKEEVKAFYLAQEAMEIIKNKRDSNQLNIIKNGSGHWLSGITQDVVDNCFFGKICRVESSNPSNFSYCGTTWGDCLILRQNSTTFLYGYNATWPATNFKREIQIEYINDDEIAVTVRVSWTKGIITREFKAKTHLFRWI